MNPSKKTSPSGEACDRPVFDASVLSTMFDNEQTLIANLLQTFVSSTRANMAALLQAMATQDLPAVAALAHKIAGASRMSGALALGDCAHSLEQTAKRGDATALPHGAADLEAKWALALADIAKQVSLS